MHDLPPSSSDRVEHVNVAPADVRGAPVGTRSSLPIVIGAVVLLIAAAVGVWRLSTNRTAVAAAETVRRTDEAKAGTDVRTTVVSLSPAMHRLTLLGEARPYATVTLYAKVAGYLKSVPVDVGDAVPAGAVLATIESPETDRALAGANADYENKKVISDRVGQLLVKKLVSPQEADQARTDAAMAQQRLESLREQQGYESLRAPFAGTVTARFADVGALVQSAANSQTSALPVATVSQTERLRILLYLDQADAAAAHVGTPAVVSLADRPDVQLHSRIARVSGEIDPKTRKMLAEVDVENPGRQIVAGSFVQVDIELPNAVQPQAPAEALLVRAGKTYVGRVDDQARVHLQPVVVGTNDGKVVTFASGLAVGDRVALNLGSAIADGDRVRLAADRDTPGLSGARDPAAAAPARPAGGR